MSDPNLIEWWWLILAFLAGVAFAYRAFPSRRPPRAPIGDDEGELWDM
jgi:hypothetical protein